MDGQPPLSRDRFVKPSIAALFGLLTVWSTMPGSWADEAQWIWNTDASLDSPIEVGQTCLFRKPINLRAEAEGTIEISADDEYQLFVNGATVGRGSNSRQMDTYDITDFLGVGRNLIAVRATNTRGDTAAMVARVSIKPAGSGDWYNFHSDPSWKVADAEDPMWETVTYNDRLWGAAGSYGVLGDTVPWDRQENVIAATESEQSERFQIQRGFGVQRVLHDDDVGSVIAMTFNEFGHLIVSREGGPLLLVFDRDEDGIPDTVKTYCEDVTSCQGILALNGKVFVTGNGPDGHALYRLSDNDRNGSLENVETVLKFETVSSGVTAGEHGAHGLRLGPDGMIYVALGSHVRVPGGGPGETLRDFYEGDLVKRYEDPAGHGLGVKAPGGTIIRTNTTGSVVEHVAGGLRNAYDMIFHPGGGLFAHDADMEADIGTSWYRGTALVDVTEAGEFGWRTGWAKWPSYYLDRLPDVLDTGRGSPTGGVCYEHYMFPVRYHNSLFLADWSEGRILNVRLQKRGGSYIADSEVFLRGQPLNVTDIEVAPDGTLYFCTGGRGTAGGVYRVVYKGKVPDRIKNIGTGIAAAIRQPQIGSAWSRQEIAAIKRELGSQWSQLIAGVAYSDDNPPHYRTRAMDLMQLFGPVPSDVLLDELTQSPSEAVRARAATLIGLHPAPATTKRLAELIADSDPMVRRTAAEALLRCGQFPTAADDVIALLAEEDRTINFLGRHILQRMPTASWKSEVLATDDLRIAINGALALVCAEPTPENALVVLERCSELMTRFLSDADFVDLLRVCQVALHRGEIDPQDVAPLAAQIAEEFPAGDHRMNHELIRLCAYLDADGVAPRALDYINGDAPMTDRTLVAMYLQFLSHDWNAAQRFEVLKYYEAAAEADTEGSLGAYVMAATRDFAKTLSDDDIQAILEQGDGWRNAALAAMYRLDRPIDASTAQVLCSLDEQLVADPRPGDIEKRLRTVIVAMLATSKEEFSLEYLRTLWRTEPQRRPVVSMALAQNPGGDNWDYLVRSLNILEDAAASEVVTKLRGVDIATDDPMALRHLILLGVRQESAGDSFEDVERLLEHWTGLQRPTDAKPSMRSWQKWYAETYPDRIPAEPPSDDQTRWDFDQLVGYLDSEDGRYGDPTAGHEVYKRVLCADCHRRDGEGSVIGPTLDAIGRRYTRREIVESILYPAHVISDQYASKKVLTVDGRLLIGMLSQAGERRLEIRDANNDVITIDESEVDQILPSNSSIMPSGLLDDLTLQEISDLMAYLGVIRATQIATRPED